ncbi:hypothetical protein TURU_068383 [Turdus rufiventris]|nr:hypothetical protein TURU_068383 [Turdus rufiventris]
MAPPHLWANLCAASADPPACDALLNELLEQWEEEELQDRAVAAERDNDTESVLSLPLQDTKAEAAPSPQDSDSSDEGHMHSLSTALPKDQKMFEACTSMQRMTYHGCRLAVPRPPLPRKSPAELGCQQGLARCLPRPCFTSFLLAPLAVQPSRRPQPHVHGSPWPRGPGGLCASSSPSAASGGGQRSEPRARTRTMPKVTHSP